MMDMEKLSNCLDSGKDDDVMLPGFRFHPTDEELVGFYLRRKVEKKPLNIELIKHIDIYKYDPWDLPKVSTVGDKEWYFFCIRERKYRNSIRPNRVTGSGFWKATGIDRPVYSFGSEPPHDCIGLKKSLVYYRGSAGKGTKTDWMMHEFRLPPGDKISSKLPNSKSTTAAAEEAEIWTLCRIFKRNVSYKKFLPNWRATNSAPIKQTVTESSSTSQTCSFESVNIDKYTSFGPSVVVQQMKEKKPVANHINEKSHVFADQLSSVSTNHHHHHHDPVAAISSNFPNSNNGNNDFFRDGNWDELGRMLEFSSDSSFLYNCR